MQNKFLNVLYHNRQVGRLAEADRRLAFEYSVEWLTSGFSISPFKLPLEKRVFVAPLNPFGGNFGVFNDSLPDGWGRLLIDRMLVRRGIHPAEVPLLDRLAIVGTNGVGALEYKPEEDLASGTMTGDLNALAREAESILNEKDVPDGSLAELVKLGGSSGGARPKVLVKIDGEDWIIKFRASTDPKNMGKREYDYSVKAWAAGLDMPETRLFEKKFFGVKRFDRSRGKKIFMLSAAGLLETSHRLPALDYVDLLNAALKLTRDFGEVEKLFRLMCFNVYAHNRDDHAKNFAFLYDGGQWRVSPPYDLTYAEGMGGEHATAIDGEGRNPTDEDISRAAKKAGIPEKRTKAIMAEVKAAVFS